MTRSVGKELLNVPFPELVLHLGSAIAEAQYKMDLESIEILKMMGEKNTVTIPTPTFKGDEGIKNEISTSMIGAGFQPTFYQFAETIIEVKMAISMSEEKETVEEGKKTSLLWAPSVLYRPIKGGRYIRTRRVLYTTPMDAKYTNKYSYHQEGESTLRTRLVPVPPNTVIQRFIDLKAMEIEAELQKDLDDLEKSTQSA